MRERVPFFTLSRWGGGCDQVDYCFVKLHKRKFYKEEIEVVTQTCILYFVLGSFDDNSLDGVPVIRAGDRYT